MDEAPKPYLLTEAAELTGLSVDALRKRVKRRTLRGNKSNEDGQWRVWLTSGNVEFLKMEAATDRPVDVQADESRRIRELEDVVAELRERVGRAEGEATGLREALRRADAAAEEAKQRALAMQVEWEAAKDAWQAARDHAGRAESEAAVLRDVAEQERKKAATERAERKVAELELASWTAGGPFARAVRAFLNRRWRA